MMSIYILKVNERKKNKREWQMSSGRTSLWMYFVQQHLKKDLQINHKIDSL